MLSLFYVPTLISVHDHWKSHSFDNMDLCWQSDTSFFFNMLSRFVIAFPPRNKSLLIQLLQLPSTVILEPRKIKSATISTFSPFLSREVIELDAMILVVWILSFKPVFHFPLSPPSRSSFVPLHFLPLEWYNLYIWGCLYFSQQSWFHPACRFIQCTLHRSWIKQDDNIQTWIQKALLSQFWTSPLFHVQF